MDDALAQFFCAASVKRGEHFANARAYGPEGLIANALAQDLMSFGRAQS